MICLRLRAMMVFICSMTRTFPSGGAYARPARSAVSFDRSAVRINRLWPMLVRWPALRVLITRTLIFLVVDIASTLIFCIGFLPSMLIFLSVPVPKFTGSELIAGYCTRRRGC